MPFTRTSLSVLCLAVLALPSTLASGQKPRGGSGGASAAAQDGGKVLPADAVEQDVGVPGTEYPLVKAVLRSDAALHDDTTGTSPKELLELAGMPGPGGPRTARFAAVWQDHRDGHMGLYFARIAADGSGLEAERPAYSTARASRELDPSIALAASGAGVLSWREKSMPNGFYFTRLFDVAGKLSPQHLPMGFEIPAAGGRGRDAGLVMPSVGVLPDGSGVCVWLAGERAMVQTIRAVGPIVEQPNELSRDSDPATSRPVLGASAEGTWLAAWGTRGGVECLIRGLKGGDVRNALGFGVPLEVHADLAGGWWLLAEHEGRRVLRHANSRGKVDREVALEGTPVDVAIASFGALIVQAPREGRQGAQRLQLVPLAAAAESGAPAREPIELTSETGRILGNVRVAAAGDTGLVGWRERRGGDHVICVRTVAADGSFGPAREISTDRGSANQTAPDIASNGEDRAVSAWVDRRDAEGDVYVRLLDAQRGNASPEFQVPAPFGAAPNDPAAGGAAGDELAAPSVAMARDSRFAVAWFVVRDRATSLYVQAFASDAKPLGAPVAYDTGLAGVGEALLSASDDGYVLYWKRGPDGGLVARRLDFNGLPLGDAVPITNDASAQNVAACRLDVGPRERESRAWAVAWDVDVPGAGRRLRVRVLSNRLEPQGRELGFDTMYLGADWDPAIAPAADGGFVLFWTTGDGRARDVFTRAFDGEGKPRTRPLAVSVRANEQDYPEIARLADGSYALVWEDDISLWDYVNVRRLSKDAKTLGPALQLCERPDEFLRSHTHGKLARFGEGFVSVWSDTRRSAGSDVYWKLVGARFDAPGGSGNGRK